MAQLGSMFEVPPDGERGADLHVEVVANRGRVAAGVPVRVLVARAVPDREGVMRTRAHDPHDRGDVIELNLPAGFPNGGRIRLRGRGAAGGVAPGDLYIRVLLGEVDEPPLPPGPDEPRRDLVAADGAGARDAARRGTAVGLIALVLAVLGALGWLLSV